MITRKGIYDKEKYQRKLGRLVVLKYDLKRERLTPIECDTEVSIGMDKHK